MKKRTGILLLSVIFFMVGCGVKQDSGEGDQTLRQTQSETATVDGDEGTGRDPAKEQGTENAAAEHRTETSAPDAAEGTENKPMSAYELEEVPGMTVSANEAENVITQRATVDGTAYSLTINLEEWAKNTSMEQVLQCTRTFWYCYPKMYGRFAGSRTPRDVTLVIRDKGYEIAYTERDTVVLNDHWLEENTEDYDCLTHEFAHVVQTGWEDAFVPTEGEDTYMIERFADYCRFVYCWRDGYYNDAVWTLQTAEQEDSFVSSVRFWVWLDEKYSTDEQDIIRRMSDAIREQEAWASTENWSAGGEAWQQVFEGTGAAGKDLNELWEEYAADDFAYADATASGFGEKSPLEKSYGVRAKLKARA